MDTKRTTTNLNLHWNYAVIITALVALSVIFVHISSRNNDRKRTDTTEILGGIYNETANVPFVNPYEIELIYKTMTEITSKCSPSISPTVDPIYDILKLGTLAETSASWLQLKSHINGTGPNKCIFYGLDAAKIRTGSDENVADICHSYMTATLEFFAVNNLTGQQEADLTSYMFNGVLAAYPLNIYWKNTLGANWVTDVVLTGTTGLQAEILSFYEAFRNGDVIDIVQISTRFCNQYFARDQLQYHNLAVMPHLAFPFEGLVNKLAQSTIAVPLMQMLGKLTIPEGQDIKRAFFIDPQSENGIATDPATLLFLKSMLHSTPVSVISGKTVFESMNDISESILNVVNGIQIPGSVNQSLVPVLVFGRFVDDIQTYQSFKSQPRQIMMAFSADDPENLLRDEYLGSVLQNAASQDSVSIFDTSVVFSFESRLGQRYRSASQVSDLLNMIMGTNVYAGTTAAWDILDTFAMKNTLVEGIDIGLRLEFEAAMLQMDREGLSTGLQPTPFAMELIQGVTTPSTNNNTGGANLNGNIDNIPGFGGGSGARQPLPLSFDWRKESPICVAKGQDQGSCNNCWAIASSAMAGSRICIKTGVTSAMGSARSFLSTQQITACSKGIVTNTDGCNPQQANAGFSFMTGDMTTRECMGEVFRGRSTNGQCPQVCRNGKAPPVAGGIIRGTYSQLQTSKDIKTALLDGPIAVGIMFPADFFTAFPVCSPTSENFIYPISDDMKLTKSGHMMTLYGWDDTTSPPSWIIQNSHGCSSSANRDELIQGNRGFIRLAQDVNGILKGRAFWVDYNGYVADVRIAPTDPSAVLPTISQISTSSSSSSATSSSSTTSKGLNDLINSVAPVATSSKTFTSTTNCPNSIVNQRQAAKQSSIQGCPGSADNLIISSANSIFKITSLWTLLGLWIFYFLFYIF
jgi:hypothetical protein